MGGEMQVSNYPRKSSGKGFLLRKFSFYGKESKGWPVLRLLSIQPAFQRARQSLPHLSRETHILSGNLSPGFNIWNNHLPLGDSEVSITTHLSSSILPPPAPAASTKSYWSCWVKYWRGYWESRGSCYWGPGNAATFPTQSKLYPQKMGTIYRQALPSFLSKERKVRAHICPRPKVPS